MWDNPAFGPQKAPVRLPPEGSVPTKGIEPRPTMAQAASLANPVAGSAPDIARGKALFAIFCAPCHGESAKGDGPVGVKLAMRPPDLSPAGRAARLPDGALFATIGNGTDVMPSLAAELDPKARWQVVAWLRTLK
jgi:mono/diheme cytochrome c family protein